MIPFPQSEHRHETSHTIDVKRIAQEKKEQQERDVKDPTHWQGRSKVFEDHNDAGKAYHAFMLSFICHE